MNDIFVNLKLRFPCLAVMRNNFLNMGFLRYNGCMVYRLIDKVILAGLSVAALFLLFGKADGRSIIQSNEFSIACVLAIVIALLVTEVFRNQYVSAGVLILAGVLAYFVPETGTAVPACVYGLFVGFVAYKELTWKMVMEILPHAMN